MTKYTVVLVRPTLDNLGRDDIYDRSYVSHVTASDPDRAFEKAINAQIKIDRKFQSNVKSRDYTILGVFEGHHNDLFLA